MYNKQRPIVLIDGKWSRLPLPWLLDWSIETRVTLQKDAPVVLGVSNRTVKPVSVVITIGNNTTILRDVDIWHSETKHGRKILGITKLS